MIATRGMLPASQHASNGFACATWHGTAPQFVAATLAATFASRRAPIHTHPIHVFNQTRGRDNECSRSKVREVKDVLDGQGASDHSKPLAKACRRRELRCWVKLDFLDACLRFVV